MVLAVDWIGYGGIVGDERAQARGEESERGVATPVCFKVISTFFFN